MAKSQHEPHNSNMNRMFVLILAGVFAMTGRVFQASGAQIAELKGDAGAESGNPFIAQNDVTWNTLGSDENSSMPIGNGDLAANVWTEKSGDLVMLLAKADAWTEIGKLVKLGRIRVKLTPNPFKGAS